jgi:ACR3 family arsenite efflux pump ArsB
VAMYGVGSYAALGTTMGLFWEVPIMLGLVYLGKALEKRGFWPGKSLRSGQLAEVPVETTTGMD